MPPEEVSYNKSQDALTIRLNRKLRPEEENRPKTPSPVDYDKHPGHDGPMLRDGKSSLKDSDTIVNRPFNFSYRSSYSRRK